MELGDAKLHRRKAWIVAEAGVNHNGDLQLGYELIHAAQKAGADAIKFQTFEVDQLVLPDTTQAPYQRRQVSSRSQYEMLHNLHLTHAEQRLLYDYARSIDIFFFSTPFDLVSLQFLIHDLGLPTVKIASSDLTNVSLLFAAARSRAAIILSTGMATISEVTFALQVIGFGLTSHHLPSTTSEISGVKLNSQMRSLLAEKVQVMHCTTSYPTDPADANLTAIPTLQRQLEVPIGFSDHTAGIDLAPVAVALGASSIEKHLTLDREMDGPDHEASIEPAAFAELVTRVRLVESALGNGEKTPSASELENIRPMRKGLYAARQIRRGQVLSEDDIACLRPLGAQGANHYFDWIGRPAPQDYVTHQPLE